MCVRGGGGGICNGRRERVPGGPFPFSIAVCFLHPVIVGNEVGNTDRSSSFYFLLNAGTAGHALPSHFSHSHFESLHLSIPSAAAGLPLRTFLASEISLGLANSCVRVILNFFFFFPARLPNDSFAKRHKRSSSAGDIISSNFSFFGFFFSPLANEIESHFVVKRPDRPDGYYVVYNITMSIRGSEKMPPPTRLETLFSLSVPRNKETNI